MRATIAHEVGHVYGLDEAYLPGFACNPAITSIMYALVRDINGAISNGCDGNVVQSDDFSKAHWFQVMNLSSFQPQNLRSYKTSSDVMYVYWDDASPSEAGYKMYAFYWTGSYWQQFNDFYYTYNVAPGDPWQTSILVKSYRRPWNLPATWYISCMYVNSGVIGDRYWKCFPVQWLGSGPG